MASRKHPRPPPLEELVQARANTLLEAAEAMERNAHACAALSSALEAEAEGASSRLAGPLRARAMAVRLATKAALSHARVFRREALRVQSDLDVVRSRAQLRESAPRPLAERKAQAAPAAAPAS
jgi:hypothetical protein